MKDSRYNATPYEYEHLPWISPRELRERDRACEIPSVEFRAWAALRCIANVLDTSDLSDSHNYFTLGTTEEERNQLLRDKESFKKVTGRWAFECGSNTIRRYALLRAKSYRLDFFENDASKVRCKGADKKSLTDVQFDSFLFCALGKHKYLNIYAPQGQIRSRNNVMYFDCFTKKIFDASVTKRFLMPQPRYTAIYGYHYLRELREVWNLLLDLISQLE